MGCRIPRSMTPKEYSAWVKRPESRKASLPSFFPKGVERTMNVLKGKASEASVRKRDSFVARHMAQYCSNPTERRRIAIRNWGYALGKRQ